MKAAKQNKDQDLIFEAYVNKQREQELIGEATPAFIQSLKGLGPGALKLALQAGLKTKVVTPQWIAQNVGKYGITDDIVRSATGKNPALLRMPTGAPKPGLNTADDIKRAADDLKAYKQKLKELGKTPTEIKNNPLVKQQADEIKAAQDALKNAPPAGTTPPPASTTPTPAGTTPTPAGTTPAAPGAAGAPGARTPGYLRNVTTGDIAKGGAIAGGVGAGGVGGVLAYQNFTPADVQAIQSNNIDLLQQAIDKADGERKIALQKELDRILIAGGEDATTRATQTGKSVMDRIGDAASKAFTTDGEIDYGKVAKAGAIGAGLGIGGKLAYDHLKPKKDKDEDEDEA